MNIYLDLFLTFARVGVCTFGGGYAMLPILQREVVDNKGWATEEQLADYYAIGQCTPGIIAVNTATFVGRTQRGTAGGVIATLGVVFPSVVIILLIAAFLQNFAHLPVVIHAFAGVRACVCALILTSVLKLRKTTVVDLPTGNAIRDAWVALERESAPPRTLRIFPGEGYQVSPGMSGSAMVLPQAMFQLLRERLEGIAQGESDGQHGEVSVQNTLWLQNLAQLEQTGVMDQPTWDMLSRLYELFITAGP